MDGSRTVLSPYCYHFHCPFWFWRHEKRIFATQFDFDVTRNENDENENADENAKVSENQWKQYGYRIQCKWNEKKMETEMKTVIKMQKQMKMKTKVAEPPRIP